MVNSKKIKIVIFGSSGYIGSNLVREFSNLKYELTLFDFKKNIQHNKFKFIEGNILEISKVEKAIKGSDYVFNLAGEAGIEESNLNINSTIQKNILGNVNILNACVKYKVKKIIYASSMYVFGKYGGIYKTTKLTSEEFVRQYKNIYKLKYTIIRYGSLFGSEFDKKSAIHDMIISAISKSTITYNGKSDSMRQYIHIKDAVIATIKTMDKKYDNSSVSIVGNENYRVKDIMILISEILNKKVKYKFIKKNNSHYRLTPFTLSPELGITLKLEDFIDIPQGLYEEIKRLSKK